MLQGPVRGVIGIELCLLNGFADVLCEGEGEDADDDEVIVPSRRWSSLGPGEATSVTHFWVPMRWSNSLI